MNFWNFLKKSNKEVDEALDKCAASYNEFQEHIHQGHFQHFKDFKVKFRKESLSLRKEIVDCKDNNLKLLLINHLQKQLDYLNENYFGPYAAKVDLDKFNEFVANNYPYEKKVEQLKCDYFLTTTKNEKFLKPGITKFEKIIGLDNIDDNPLVNRKKRM